MIILALIVIAATCLIAAYPYQTGEMLPFILLLGVIGAAVKSRKHEGV